MENDQPGPRRASNTSAVPAPGAAGGERAGASGRHRSLRRHSAGVIWPGPARLSRGTRDGGHTWANVTPPRLPPTGINVIDASHASEGTAYAALLSRDAHPHIYRTSDYGKTWQEISTGLTDGEMVEIVKGVSAGDRVIVKGQNGLPDGADVTIGHESIALSICRQPW
jgi:photosystem II stability/assembly factor-like uncharacterized protein